MVENTLHSIKVKADLHACMADVCKLCSFIYIYNLIQSIDSGLLAADSPQHSAEFPPGHPLRH